MMVNLVRVEYDRNSRLGCVQACLKRKIEIAQSLDNGGINGIGPLSCCCFVSYVTRDGKPGNIVGNSRAGVPFKFINQVNAQEVRNACVHGELGALWNLLEEENEIPHILEMYIEMSPCAKCGPALKNLLASQPQLEVYYSFDHPDQVRDWQVAATALCNIT